VAITKRPHTANAHAEQAFIPSLENSQLLHFRYPGSCEPVPGLLDVELADLNSPMILVSSATNRTLNRWIEVENFTQWFRLFEREYTHLFICRGKTHRKAKAEVPSGSPSTGHSLP
jgi:hypothetical protein